MSDSCVIDLDQVKIQGVPLHVLSDRDNNPSIIFVNKGKSLPFPE